MKPVAFVVQRYGAEVNGGAELLCRQVAERLQESFPVDVLTTCAVDYITWKNEYPIGESRINGVRVRRFPVDFERRRILFHLLSRLTIGQRSRWLAGFLPSRYLQYKWMMAQGPYSSHFLTSLRSHSMDYSVFVFFTYLYCSTYFGLPLVPTKSILVPTAHDEPPLYMDIFKEEFNLPQGIIYCSIEERDLVHRVFNNRRIPGPVLGIGVDPPQTLDVEGFRRKYNLRRDYILYVGRVDPAKNCQELFENFQKYLKNSKREITLLLVGRPTMPIPKHPCIISLGFIPEGEKWAAMAGARVNVVPSKFESLSISLLEGWSLGIPALVNGHCSVLKGHILRSGGGLDFTDYRSFKLGLDQIISGRMSTHMMGEKGRSYVQENYRWQGLIERYKAFLNPRE